MENKLNNNNFELWAGPLNEKLEFNCEREKLSINVSQIETTVVEPKMIDETNDDCCKKEKILIGSDSLEENNTNEATSKVSYNNSHELMKRLWRENKSEILYTGSM